MPEHTDNSEAMRLADELDDDFAHGRISNHCGRKAAALLRKLPERIAELEAERDRLLEEVEQWRAHKEVLKASHLDESLTIRMTMRHKGLNVEREGVLTMLAAEHAIAGGDEIAAHMAGRYFNEMKSAIDAARTTHKETE